MKPKTPDLMIMLPVEYTDALLEVINVGFQRAKINPSIRKELFSWWEAEKELIMESKNNQIE